MQALTPVEKPVDVLTGRQAAARLAAVTAVFAALYHCANWLTHSRADVATGLLPWDAAIPFMPWTVLPYLSIVVPYLVAFHCGRCRVALNLHVLRVLVLLAIALACYALVPLRHTFQRPAVEGALGMLFVGLSACDLPYNRAPSLHIGLLVLLWARLCPAVDGAARWLLQGWLLVIGASVLTTWQHHLVDVPAGLAAGGLALALTAARVRQVVAAVVRRLRALPVEIGRRLGREVSLVAVTRRCRPDGSPMGESSPALGKPSLAELAAAGQTHSCAGSRRPRR